MPYSTTKTTLDTTKHRQFARICPLKTNFCPLKTFFSYFPYLSYLFIVGVGCAVSLPLPCRLVVLSHSYFSISLPPPTPPLIVKRKNGPLGRLRVVLCCCLALRYLASCCCVVLRCVVLRCLLLLIWC
jgi:hypothetical protein